MIVVLFFALTLAWVDGWMDVGRGTSEAIC